MSEAVYDPNGLRDDLIARIPGSIVAGEILPLGTVPDGYVGRLSAISFQLDVAATTVQASGSVRYLDPSGDLIYVYTPSGLQNSYAAALTVTTTGYVGNNTDIFQFSSNNADGVLEQCNLVDQWLQAGCSWELEGFSFHQGEVLHNVVVGITLIPALRSIFPNSEQVAGNQQALAFLLHNP